MIKSNNNLGYVTPGILQVEDFQNIKEYSSYMMPNNIVLASYQMNVFKDYRNYSGYSYELYYLDDHSYVHQLTYNILPGNGLVIDENGLASIEIDNHTLQNAETGLSVNTYNLNTAYSYYQKGLIVGDNINYRDFLSNFKESGFTETRDGIVSLNHGFVHEILDIKNIGKKIDVEIENINNLLVRMFKSRKYYVGDILYFDTNTLQLVDEHNANAIPYMICVISSDVADDKLPRFIKIEEKNYYYPQSSFISELENIEDLSYTYYFNTYTWVPIYDVPWSQIKVNSNIIYGSYGFIALDREDWVDNFKNPFNYEEHYYCNAKEKYTGWYLDASYVSYNNPNVEDWLVEAGGFYTYNISKEIIKNVDNFYDLTDDICVIYNNIIKHYKVEFKYDKNNNKYVSKSNSPAIGGTNGIYVMSENSIAMNINWSNILKNPYIKDGNEYKLNSAFIPYREIYNYKHDKLEKDYINLVESSENTIENILSNLEYLNMYPDKFDWEWKQDINYNSELSDDEYKTYCNTVTYINLSKLVDKTGIPNIGLKLQYEYKNEGNKNYKIDYEYFVFKSKYYSYKFTSKDPYYMKKNKTSKYYSDSSSYITRLYDLNNNFMNWQSSYNYDLYIPNCYNYNSNMESNKPTISIIAYNLNDLSFNGVGLGKYPLKHQSFKDVYGKETISYFYMDLGSEKVLGNGLGQNHMVSNTINKELRDYRLATEGPVYFKPDYTYITAQQSDNEYLLHYEVGNIIGDILDYRSTFIDYYLFANKANYTWGKCNILSSGCIWLHDPYKILNIYDNQNVLISLNVYGPSEEIFINKLFKFKIQYDSTSNSYMLPDWHDANTNEYLLQCEQADISRITFNYAIDFDSYDKHKRIEELDDVPLAPEGTIIYIPPEPVEETPEPETPSDGGESEPSECKCNPPDKPVEMWIVEDYVEKEDDYVFLHDMAIGIKFKESNWGDAMVNGSRTNLRLGSGGNIYILYFEMQYPQETTEISGKKYVAFTYRNYSDSKGYVLKLCVNETIAINRYDKSSWTKDTNSILPSTRNDDLLKFNLNGKTIESYFKTSEFKFELIGIGLITSSTQLSRYFIEIEDTKYHIDTYYQKDPYKDVKGSINMTERVTVWNAFKYFKRFTENPPFNNFNVWPKTNAGPDTSGTPVNPDSEQFNMSLGKLYKTKDSNTSIIYIGSKFYTGGSDGAGTTEPTEEPEEPIVAPESINVDGETYFKEELLGTCPEPNEDYERKSVHNDEFNLDYFAWVKKPGPTYEDQMIERIAKIEAALNSLFSGLNGIIAAIYAGNEGWTCKNCGTTGNKAEFCTICGYDYFGNPPGGGTSTDTPSPGGTTSNNAIIKMAEKIFNNCTTLTTFNSDNVGTVTFDGVTFTDLNFSGNICNPTEVNIEGDFVIELKKSSSGTIKLGLSKDGTIYTSKTISIDDLGSFTIEPEETDSSKFKITDKSQLGILNELFNLDDLRFNVEKDTSSGTYIIHLDSGTNLNILIKQLNNEELSVNNCTGTVSGYEFVSTNSKLTASASSTTLVLNFNPTTPTETITFNMYNFDNRDITSNNCYVNLPNSIENYAIVNSSNDPNIYSSSQPQSIFIQYLSNTKFLSAYDDSTGQSRRGGLIITYQDNLSNYVEVECYKPNGTEVTGTEKFDEQEVSGTYSSTGYLKIKLTQESSNPSSDIFGKKITINPKGDTTHQITINILAPDQPIPS